jgi:hypothetical protein
MKHIDMSGPIDAYKSYFDSLEPKVRKMFNIYVRKNYHALKQPIPCFLMEKEEEEEEKEEEEKEEKEVTEEKEEEKDDTEKEE